MIIGFGERVVCLVSFGINQSKAKTISARLIDNLCNYNRARILDAVCMQDRIARYSLCIAYRSSFRRPFASISKGAIDFLHRYS